MPSPSIRAWFLAGATACVLALVGFFALMRSGSEPGGRVVGPVGIQPAAHVEATDVPDLGRAHDLPELGREPPMRVVVRPPPVARPRKPVPPAEPPPTVDPTPPRPRRSLYRPRRHHRRRRRRHRAHRSRNLHRPLPRPPHQIRPRGSSTTLDEAPKRTETEISPGSRDSDVPQPPPSDSGTRGPDDRGRMRILLQRQPVPTLSEVLASGPLDVRTSLRLLFGVATAVDALSKAGLVARDLTPDRILVCPRRGGILADPGIPLELLPRDSGPDDPDSQYRSPEELGGGPIDSRSNVYSMAAVFLATMTAPDGERLALPAPAKAVIGRAMASDPARRYASPPEFIITMASAFGVRQRDGSGGKRSPAATQKGEPAPTVASSPPAKALPESTREESESDDTTAAVSRSERVPARLG